MPFAPLASTRLGLTGAAPGVTFAAAIANAIRLLASQPEAAGRQAKAVLKVLPRDGRALYFIGAARRRCGDLAGSKRKLTPLAAPKYDSAEVHFDPALGVAVACECGADFGALRRGADLEAN
jgi:hypothetical protein